MLSTLAFFMIDSAALGLVSLCMCAVFSIGVMAIIGADSHWHIGHTTAWWET